MRPPATQWTSTTWIYSNIIGGAERFSNASRCEGKKENAENCLAHHGSLGGSLGAPGHGIWCAKAPAVSWRSDRGSAVGDRAGGARRNSDAGRMRPLATVREELVETLMRGVMSVGRWLPCGRSSSEQSFNPLVL